MYKRKMAHVSPRVLFLREGPLPPRAKLTASPPSAVVRHPRASTYIPHIPTTMSVITVSTFDAKNLTVSEAKKLDNGSSQTYVNYKGGRVRIQAPRMPVPYDCGDYQGNEKYKVQLSFRDRATNTAVAAYQKMVEDIDNFIIDQATKNAGKWFKMAGASREMIALFYTPSLKIAKDKDGNPKDYPPTQAVAIKKRSGAFDAELYDDKNRLMEGLTPLDVLRRGAEVTAILDLTGVWIADKKFGATWKLHQVRVDVPGEGSGAARGFLGADAGAPVSSVPVVTAAAGGAGVSAAEEADLLAAVLPSAGGAGAAAAGDDEEDEEDIAEDEVVKPVPVPAKKPAVAAAPAAAAAAPAAVKKVVKKVVTKP